MFFFDIGNEYKWNANHPGVSCGKSKEPFEIESYWLLKKTSVLIGVRFVASFSKHQINNGTEKHNNERKKLSKIVTW